MSYKTMVVHVDRSRHAAGRIRLAAQLARAHGAHLVGVAATGVSRDVFPQGYRAEPGSLEAGYFEPLQQNARAALEQFAAIAAAQGVAHEERLVWDMCSEALALQARFGDLAIVNQDDFASGVAEAIGRIPEYVAFTSARPVLLVPCAPVASPPGQHVLVAWNGSKEACAALRAALPMLRRAARVSVVSFRYPDEAGEFDAQDQEDLIAFLSRHDIGAEVMVFKRHVDCGHALLTLAEQDGYDLLVMGCYGHSRFRELFLGGVTRTVLHRTRIPVLLAR
jgi:nucleotide-binding universal stress UspA family protein